MSPFGARAAKAGQTTEQAWLASRLIGVDVARAFAILGMFVLHTLPPGTVWLFDLLASGGRPQVLFALLDGVGLALMTGAAMPPSELESKRLLRLQIAARGVLLVALGLFLSTLGTGIVVILDYYGVYFFLMLPMLFLRARFIALPALLLLVAGPWLSSLISDATGFTYVPAVNQLLAWLFTGTYPAIIYLGYVLVGVYITRTGMLWGRRSVAASAIATAIAASAYLAVVFLEQNLSWVAVSTLESVGAASINVALVGALTFGLDGLRPPRNRVPGLTHPLRVLGAMPISIYSFHVVYVAVIATTMFAQSSIVPDTRSIGSFVALIALSVSFAVAWNHFFGRGPLERLSRSLSPRALPYSTTSTFSSSGEDAET